MSMNWKNRCCRCDDPIDTSKLGWYREDTQELCQSCVRDSIHHHDVTCKTITDLQVDLEFETQWMRRYRDESQELHLRIERVVTLLDWELTGRSYASNGPYFPEAAIKEALSILRGESRDRKSSNSDI